MARNITHKTPSDAGYVDTAAVCEYLGVTRSGLDAWIRDDGLPCYRPGRKVRRFRLAEIDEWMAARREAAA